MMALPTLHREILAEIGGSGGMIPFRRFMELALYHPEHGYYASGRARVGRQGDFFTSVSVGRIYGRILSSVCREVWERLGSPDHFTIVEQGANDGAMAADILGAVSEEGGAFAKALRYLIVEPFAVNRRRQVEKLGAFPEVGWVGSPEELPEFTGIHLSNELLDAFPVHSVRWSGGEWREEVVTVDGDWLLVRKDRPITDPALLAAVTALPVTLPDGFLLEINPDLAPWLDTLHRKLRRGVVVTVDYGQAGDDRYTPHRRDGTLLAYRNHERFDDTLSEPGLRDITAQVDFTDLASKARETGFTVLGYSDQHHFLVGAAEPWLRSLGDLTPGSDAALKDLRALQTLLNPATMGRQFKAIAFGKDFAKAPLLSCFARQRPGPGVLGDR